MEKTSSTGEAAMKKLLLGFWLCVCPTLSARTYYISNSGSDQDTGTSVQHPWASIAKLNMALLSARPGDTFLLRRGDVFRDDSIRCINSVHSSPSTTLASNPPKCSGTAQAPITIDCYGSGPLPLIDAADPLSRLSWNPVSQTTFAAPLPEVPKKLYVDSALTEAPQILPVPNGMGDYSGTQSYPYLSLVAFNTKIYVCGNPIGCTGQIPTQNNFWTSLSNPTAGNHTQAFVPSNTGRQNVDAIPGSFWYDSLAHIVYVHLADGSNPAAHHFEVTKRDYGLYLQSTNYVTVRDIAVAHPFYDAFAAVSYSDSSNGYVTNEYIQFINDSAWNYGSIALDTVTGQIYGGRAAQAVAGYLFMPMLGNQSHPQALMPGQVVEGSYVGIMDTYFALRASRFVVSGIRMGGASDGVIAHNKGVVVNAACMIYGPFVTSFGNDAGGEMAYNTCTNSQGNFFFGGTVGGHVHDNTAYDSAGEGIQLGGNLAGMGSPEIDHNLLYNLGLSADTSLYNGIDCNSRLSFAPYLHHNTIVNVYAAAITMENVCDHMKADANILSQAGATKGVVNFQADRQGNGSNLVYISASVGATHSWTWSHNLYQAGPNPILVGFRRITCDTLKSELDPTGVCGDPLFVAPTKHDFRLRPGSPAIDQAASDHVIGALPPMTSH